MTTFETNLTQELADLQAYIAKHNMQDDDFAKEEVARLTKALAAETARPKMWLTASTTQRLPGEVIDAYLGFGAQVQMFLACKRGSTIAIIEVPAEHAQWQSMRLGSGMLGGHIYESYAEALTAAQELTEII